eukprot:gene1917-2599_t
MVNRGWRKLGSVFDESLAISKEEQEKAINFSRRKQSLLERREDAKEVLEASGSWSQESVKSAGAVKKATDNYAAAGVKPDQPDEEFEEFTLTAMKAAPKAAPEAATFSKITTPSAGKGLFGPDRNFLSMTTLFSKLDAEHFKTKDCVSRFKVRVAHNIGVPQNAVTIGEVRPGATSTEVDSLVTLPGDLAADRLEELKSFVLTNPAGLFSSDDGFSFDPVKTLDAQVFHSDAVVPRRKQLRQLGMSALVAAATFVLSRLSRGNSTTCMVQHHIEKGENLYRISKEFHTTIPELKEINQLENENLIFAGAFLQDTDWDDESMVEYQPGVTCEYVAEAPNVFIEGPSGLIYDANYSYIVVDASGPFLEADGRTNLSNPMPSKLENKNISQHVKLASSIQEYGDMYYSFLLETLPKLLLLQPFLADDLERQPWEDDYLGMLGFNTEQKVKYDPDVVYFATESLLYPSPVVHNEPSLNAMLATRAALNVAVLPAAERGLVIYCKGAANASSAQHVDNEDEIMAAIQTLVIPEDRFVIYDDALSMSAASTIELFEQAKVVIGPHGDGLSNILFSAPGTQSYWMIPAPKVSPTQPSMHVAVSTVKDVLGAALEEASSLLPAGSNVDPAVMPAGAAAGYEQSYAEVSAFTDDALVISGASPTEQQTVLSSPLPQQPVSTVQAVTSHALSQPTTLAAASNNEADPAISPDTTVMDPSVAGDDALEKPAITYTSRKPLEVAFLQEESSEVDSAFAPEETAAELAEETAAELGVETAAELGAETAAELGAETAAELGAEIVAELGAETAAELAAETAAELAAEAAESVHSAETEAAHVLQQEAALGIAQVEHEALAAHTMPHDEGVLQVDNTSTDVLLHGEAATDVVLPEEEAGSHQATGSMTIDNVAGAFENAALADEVSALEEPDQADDVPQNDASMLQDEAAADIDTSQQAEDMLDADDDTVTTTFSTTSTAHTATSAQAAQSESVLQDEAAADIDTSQQAEDMLDADDDIVAKTFSTTSTVHTATSAQAAQAESILQDEAAVDITASQQAEDMLDANDATVATTLSTTSTAQTATSAQAAQAESMLQDEAAADIDTSQQAEDMLDADDDTLTTTFSTTSTAHTATSAQAAQAESMPEDEDIPIDVQQSEDVVVVDPGTSSVQGSTGAPTGDQQQVEATTMQTDSAGRYLDMVPPWWMASRNKSAATPLQDVNGGAPIEEEVLAASEPAAEPSSASPEADASDSTAARTTSADDTANVGSTIALPKWLDDMMALNDDTPSTDDATTADSATSAESTSVSDSATNSDDATIADSATSRVDDASVSDSATSVDDASVSDSTTSTEDAGISSNPPLPPPSADKGGPKHEIVFPPIKIDPFDVPLGENGTVTLFDSDRAVDLADLSSASPPQLPPLPPSPDDQLSLSAPPPPPAPSPMPEGSSISDLFKQFMNHSSDDATGTADVATDQQISDDASEHNSTSTVLAMGDTGLTSSPPSSSSSSNPPSETYEYSAPGSNKNNAPPSEEEETSESAPLAVYSVVYIVTIAVTSLLILPS